MKFVKTIFVRAGDVHIVKISFSFRGWGADISLTDEMEIAAEEEEKLGSKVYALNKSPSSVHSELDASLIIAILTLHTKDRIALHYICCTVHSR